MSVELTYTNGCYDASLKDARMGYNFMPMKNALAYFNAFEKVLISGSMAQCYKTFSVRNSRIFVTS